MDSSPKLRAFLLLRYTLIIATAYLLLVERRFEAFSPVAGLLIAAALASNLAIGRLPGRVTDAPYFAVGTILFDTAWVTGALTSSGGFSADFFMLYFFLLLLAAVGENLRLIAITAGVVCAAYLWGHNATGARWDWLSPSLIRIPFLFTAAVFYGHLVDRIRQEGQRADRAESHAAQLARTVAEFKILYAKVQEAERIKTEFLATVSHELRTPLTSLSGYVELLLDGSYGAVPSQQRTVLGRVSSASQVLRRAIQRMFDASRIDGGYERVRCDEFRLDDVFDGLRSTMAPASGVALSWTSGAALPPLRSDEEKVGTIVRNLVENACKYTERGFVRVEGDWDRRGDEIIVRVSDSGIGIADAEREAIFEAFRQGANRGELGNGGIGLGLYIVQRLVARLGGAVTVESRLAMGSTFTVRIPRLLHRGDAVAAGPPTSAPAGR